MGLIIRERLLNKIFYMCEQTERGEEFQEAAHMIATEIENAPTVEAAPVVRGKWVYKRWCEFECSNCGSISDSKPHKGREPFCPNCGAKME